MGMMNKIMMGKLSTYYSAWAQQFKADKIRKRHLMSSMLKKLSRSFEWRGLHQFKLCCTQKEIEDARNALSRSKHVEVARIIMQRIMQRRKWTFFNGWRHWYLMMR